MCLNWFSVMGRASTRLFLDDVEPHRVGAARLIPKCALH